MALQIIITNAGRAALVNAAGSGTRAVTVVACGISPVALVPDPTIAALPGEIKRLSGADLSGEAASPAVMHLMVRDESADQYTIQSFALYLDDGTLFAIYGQNSAIVAKVAASQMMMAVDVDLADINAANITFGNADFLNPPATTAMQGVVELADDGEAVALVDPQRALTPRGLGLVFTAAKILAQIMTVDGAGSGLDADLLDGRDSSWFTDIAARLGYTPANRAGDLFSGSVDTQGDFNAAHTGTTNLTLEALGSVRLRLAAQEDGNIVLYRFDGAEVPVFSSDGAFFNSALPLRRQGATVWDSGNDGAGSGLDADLFDGRDSSAYAQVDTAVSFGNVTAADVIAAKGANSGVIFLGSNLQHFLYFDGANYQLPGGNLLINSGTAWHSGNDGAGSGLDADLLDGRDGSAYALVNTAVSFANVNAADVIAAKGANAGVIFLGSNLQHFLYFDGAKYQLPGGDLLINSGTAWHSGNDGAGSGLDADLLDGQDGSWYAAIADRLGFTPVQQGTGYGQQNNTVKIGWGQNGRLRLTVDTSDLGNIVTDGNLDGGGLGMNGASMRRSGNDLWGPDNDGSGSGLDADLLDGRDSSAYALVNTAVSFANVNATDMIAARSANTGVIFLGSNLQRFLYFDGANYQLPGGNLLINSGTAWHSGNDGAGSGLDADLLDGQEGSWYTAISERLGFVPARQDRKVNVDGGLLSGGGDLSGDRTISLKKAGLGDFASKADDCAVTPSVLAALFGAPGSGSVALPGGLILKYGGSALTDSSGWVRVSFDQEFPNACFRAYASNDSGAYNANSPSSAVAWAATGGFAKDGFWINMPTASGKAASAGTAAHWFAIGY